VTASAIATGALYCVPAVVWASITWRQWWYVRLHRPRSLGFRMLPLVGGAFTVHYALVVALTLAPLGLHDEPSRAVELPIIYPLTALPPIALAWEVSWLAAIALLRHALRLLPIPERRPSARWLAGNYGLAAAAASVDAWMRLAPSATPAQQVAAHRLFEASFTLLMLLLFVDLWRSARPGVWGPEHAGDIRGRADRRAPASVRTVLLAQTRRHGARPRDRQANGRSPWRAHRGRPGPAWRPPRRGPTAARWRAGMTLQQAAVAALLGLHLLVALVWGALAVVVSRLLAARRSPASIRRPLVAMSVLTAAAYTLAAFFTLVPPAIHAASPAWLRLLYPVLDACMVGALAAFRHLTWRIPIGAPAPGRARLAALYGGAAFLVLLDAVVRRTPTPPPALLRGVSALYGGYFVVVLLGAGRQIATVARRGGWRPDSVFVVRRRDLAIVGALVLANLVMSTLLLATGGWEAHPWALQTLSVGIGLTAAVPFAARALGAVLRIVLSIAAALLATGAVYAAAQLVLLPLVPRDLAAAVHVGTVLAIVALLVPGQRWLRSAVDRLLLRRTRRQLAELQSFVHTLSPELGRLECSRRVLAAVVRVLGLPGAAVVLRDGMACAEGTVDGEVLRAAWPREAAADSLPRRLYFGNEVADGALRDVLLEQRIAGIVPIVSPHVRWGDLFASTSLLGTAFAEEDAEALEMVAQQLGLLLDGTGLLERAVAVERSLAHAEKLAAIGETAARIAHDIRNPVTAARSLAQQLAREPAVPFREELGVILEELDRVERQVADLLHFARREEPRFEPVNLGALVETTVTQLRPRLESAGVVVTLDVQPGIVAWADRERLRQVLVNLVENAAEALGGAPQRELSVLVGAANGHATLRVSDTGPACPRTRWRISSSPSSRSRRMVLDSGSRSPGARWRRTGAGSPLRSGQRAG